MPSAGSLTLARLASLFLTFAFGIIGMSVGINALVKSNDSKRVLSATAALAGVAISIDTADVFDSGVVLTLVCGLTALASFFFGALHLLRPGRALYVQAAILAFLGTWLFAVLVPATDFIANRSVGITASLNGTALSQVAIQQVVEELGVSTAYHSLSYLRLPAILPWFAFLFTWTTVALSLMAAGRALTTSTYPPMSSTDNEVQARRGSTEKVNAGEAEKKNEIVEDVV